jgi:hypothetical protein
MIPKKKNVGHVRSGSATSPGTEGVRLAHVLAVKSDLTQQTGGLLGKTRGKKTSSVFWSADHCEILKPKKIESSVS